MTTTFVHNPQHAAALQRHPPFSVRSFEAHDHHTQKVHSGATGYQSLKMHPRRRGGFKQVSRVLRASGENSEFELHLNEMRQRMDRLTNILNTDNPRLYAPMYRFKYWVQDTLASKKITIGVLVVFIVLCLYVHYTPSASEKVIQLLKAIGIQVPQGVHKSVGGKIDLSNFLHNFGQLFSTDKFKQMISTPVDSILARVKAYMRAQKHSRKSRPHSHRGSRK
jgi:hypothetical protein